MTQFYKTVLARFIRAFIAGAAASMVIILPVNIHDLTTLRVWIMALGISGAVGGISGVIQALDKAYRYTPATE